MIFECEIPFGLCPINQKYFKSRTTGSFILSSKYRKCKKDLTRLFAFVANPPITGPYKIYLESHQYSDIDSHLKIIFDALEEAKVIDNDKNITKIEVVKFETKMRAKQSHFLRVEGYKVN